MKRFHIEDVEAEVKRVDEAKATALAQLQKLYDKAVQEVGESGAAIFEVHQMMMEDGDYLDSISNIIRTEGVNADMQSLQQVTTSHLCLQAWTMII